MKKIKSLMLVLALGLSVGVLASCNKNTDKPKEEEKWEDIIEDNSVGIGFAQTTAKLYAYDETSIRLTAVQGEVTLSSSDESVATAVYEEGYAYISAKKEGSATVTATCNGKQATCSVVVEKSPYAPVLVVNQGDTTINVENTDEYFVAVETEWNNTVVNDEIDYGWSFVDGEDETVISVEKSGGGFTFTALKEGTTAFNISATVRGKYVCQKVQVNVNKVSVSVVTGSDVITQKDGKYFATVYTKTQGEYSNELELDFSLFQKLTPYNKQITWTTDNATNLSLETKNGKTYAIGHYADEVEVTGSYENVDGTQSQISLTVEVERVLNEKTETLTKINSATRSNKTDLGTLDLTGYGAKIYGKTSVYYGDILLAEGNGTKIAFLTDDIPMGQDLDVELFTESDTDIDHYTLKGYFVTGYISSVYDFVEYVTVKYEDDSSPSGYVKKDYDIKGYFEVTTDIDFSAKHFQNVASAGCSYSSYWSRNMSPRTFNEIGFRGILDGKGHTFQNLTIASNGMFGSVGDGTIKNINFDIKAYHAGGYGTTLFGKTVQGATFENISIKVNSMPNSGEKYTGLLGCQFLLNSTFKNVDIDMTGYTFTTPVLCGYEMSGCTFEGCSLAIESFPCLAYKEYDRINKITAVNGLTVSKTKAGALTTENTIAFEEIDLIADRKE